MDIITFHFLSSLSVFERLEMHPMDFVTIYLYDSLDSDIYMKISERYKISEAYTLYNLFLIKL